MLIDLTYRCSMGCNHCMQTANLMGQIWHRKSWKMFWLFAKKNEVPSLIFSGGEMFEKRYILELLKIIEKWNVRIIKFKKKIVNLIVRNI